MISKKLAMLAAASLVFSSTAAVAGPAQSLSLSKSATVQRAATATKGKSNAHGSTILVGVLALAAIIGGTLSITRTSKPKSP